MSPICQTFVQNTWRKDLCSNCFKSKLEHEYNRGSSLDRVQQSNSYHDIGSLPRRYVGVAGSRIYNRNYYGKSQQWSSTLDNRESNLLKSPSLIKGMDDIIKKENEKNKHEADKRVSMQKSENDIIPSNRHSYPFRESWLYSNMNQNDENQKLEKVKDSCSDLGSDASSHDTSVSSSLESACSDSASSGRCSTELKETELDSSYERQHANIEKKGFPGILKLSTDNCKSSGFSITFNSEEQVIGYGGDVDYSDDEEELCDESDDDLSVSSLDLNPQERLMKRITEKNTDFNSENQNLSGEVLHEKYEYETPVDDAEDISISKCESKVEGKVKLRRSHNHVSIKPLLKSTVSTLQEESQIENYFDSLTSNEEEQPMKGIKPKYVSKEDEMREKIEEEDKSHNTDKVTSIDFVASTKVTSIDDVLFSASEVSNEKHNVNKMQSVKISHNEKQDTVGNEKSENCLSSANIATIQRRSSFMESQLGVTSKPTKHVSKIEGDFQSVNNKHISLDNKSDVESDLTNTKTEIVEDRSQVKEQKQFAVVQKQSSNQDETAAHVGKLSRDSEKVNSESIKVPSSQTKAQIPLTTFGTPITGNVQPQTSFLHPKSLNESETPIYAVPEILNHIPQRPQTPPQTAGIQKGALYASTSALKNIPTSKPVVTPKPIHLKDRPNLPPKMLIKPRVIPPPPVIKAQSPATISSVLSNDTEVVYAVPVMTTTVGATSPSNSSGYSSTSTLSMSPEKSYISFSESPKQEDNIDNKSTLENLSEKSSFESNRIALQSALNLTKRQAPNPPEEDIKPKQEEESHKAPITTHGSSSYFQLAPHLHDNQDFDSYSSFTDDFDDDDDETPVQSKPSAAIKSERSSSATPLYRNSTGSINFHPESGSYGMPVSFDPSNVEKSGATRSISVPRSVESSVLRPSKKKEDSSSRFSFVKTSFFRPSSPPTVKRKSTQERGRDTTKKPSSGFSLKKLLRIGSSSGKHPKPSKVEQDKEKEVNRETRKQKLNIIHPLDYNAAGVKVFARPEKTPPIYDYTGNLSSTVPSNLTEPEQTLEHKPMPIEESKHQTKDTMSTSSSERVTPIPQPYTVARNNSSGSEQSLKIISDDQKKVEKKSSFLKKKRRPQRNDSERLPPTGLTDRNSQSKLGFNSEGRPKPPPPPRKTSLECSSDSSIGTNDSKNCEQGSTSCEKRPHRPPPPRRTSNASRLAVLKPSLYANLGDVRAPFTPRKPLRSSSIREDEKEKRKAPQPPLQGTRHSSYELLIINKPAKPQLVPAYHEYEYISNDSLSQNGVGSTKGTSSASSSSSEKMTSQSNSRTSSLPNLSLEAQYGAVVLSNLEALTNLLDQISSVPESESYHSSLKKISAWTDFNLSLNDPVQCGVRLFYGGTVGSQQLTAMLTPESKVQIDNLLMPSPAVCLKHEVSSNMLSTRKEFTEPCLINATIWILPPMVLSSLEDFGDISRRLLERNPSEWERRVSLLLLQLVSALKQLQARGTEEISLDQILVADMQDSSPRLVLVPSIDEDSFESGMSLCQAASAATLLLLGQASPIESAMKGAVLSPPFTPRPHAFSSLVNTLRQERASSLTKGKCILETMLYGPLNFKPSTESNLDQSLQNWLDLERASVLQSSLGQYTSGATREIPLMFKFQLIFLVRTTLKSLKEVVKLLEAPDVTNF